MNDPTAMSPHRVSDLGTLLHALEAGDVVASNKLVAIDGQPGSGKSTLATQIAAETKLLHIEVDRFVTPGRGAFVGALRLDELRRSLDSAVTAGGAIMESVCMREVLARLGKFADMHIYVCVLSSSGRWEDEELSCAAEDGRDPVEIVRSIAAAAALYTGDTGEAPEATLALELAAYHRTYRPFQCADVVYSRTETD